jgi:undecaprenyl-diphosphatase
VSYLTAILLGVVEGLTEFLPVSSTGHLLIAERWLPRQSDLFNVVIQSGAMLAVLAVFWRRTLELLTDWRRPETRSYLLKLATAFFLTALGGVALKKLGFKLPKEIGPVAWATFLGGFLILGIERFLRGKAGVEQLSWAVVFAAAGAQVLAAAFPGTSRSGATILFAMLAGLGRVRATEFSFLLGLPTMFAAGALETFQALHEAGASEVRWGLVAVGTLASAVTAFAVVKWLLRFVQTHSFVVFGWYRIALGALLLALARTH